MASSIATTSNLHTSDSTERDDVCMPLTPPKLSPLHTMAAFTTAAVQQDTECDSKKAHGVNDSVPSPSESRKRQNDGIDTNKKLSQRPRVKKHRPKILDDSKPKKVPKAQTPRPKTPKREQKRRKHSRKNTFTGSTSRKDVQAASIIAVNSCKRSLDFDNHHVSKSHEQPLSFNCNLGEFDHLGKGRRRRRRSRFQNKCLKASENLLGDILVVRDEERVVRRYGHVYQRRKKSSSKATPKLLVYHRKFRVNQCVQNSRKSGPIFPRMFKKRRAKRKKATMNGNWWFIKPGKSRVRRSHRKMENLEINGQCKELVVLDHNVSGALVVKTDTPRKRKVVPKVELDEETLKVWKLLMENDGNEETDKDNEEWWERQREVFRGRVDSFIAKMHLIQGNRRFSPWKGSVVDSVVGAFLTQNVSDHLSSSAFMSLAARFPVKSRSKEADDHGEVATEQDMRTPTTKPREEGVPNPYMVQEGNSNAFRKLVHIEEEEETSSRVNGDLNASKEQSGLPTSHATMSDANKGGLCETSSVFRNIKKEVKNSESVQQKVTPEEEPRIEVTFEQRVNGHQSPGKKKSRIEEKQETNIDWERLRRSYCKKESNANNMDAVDWDAVRHATVEEVAETIVERGMNNKLAARIKGLLERLVEDHGTIDLEWLRDVPPDKAKEFLLGIQGIGLKSVECVRLLTLHHLAFPVDTNVGRVATRLGWVPLQPLPEEVQIHLLNSYPMVNTIQKYLFPRLCTLEQRTLYELHYQMITFGKVFCTKRNPNCNACPMRAECRHYASAFASARLALPGSKESRVTSIIPAANEQTHLDLEVDNLGSSYDAKNSEPIIEVPPSPEPSDVEETLCDIEDYFRESDDEIPTIRLNTQELRETLKNVNSISLPEAADMSKALVASTSNIRAHRMKFVGKLRTVHLVYELPDSHPSLSGFDKREHDDPSPYLLAIWLPENTEKRACNSSNKDEEEKTVKGTVLIPCRTANRGKFPLNGTYFQVNEVFADDETSKIPIDVPRCLLWDLPRRDVGCGTSATSIFKALTTSDIQRCFWRGSICVRGFNRQTRQPRPLHRRFHVSTTAVSVAAAENKE